MRVRWWYSSSPILKFKSKPPKLGKLDGLAGILRMTTRGWSKQRTEECRQGMARAGGPVRVAAMAAAVVMVASGGAVADGANACTPGFFDPTYARRSCFFCGGGRERI